jgi:hypothetical protein
MGLLVVMDWCNRKGEDVQRLEGGDVICILQRDHGDELSVEYGAGCQDNEIVYV